MTHLSIARDATTLLLALLESEFEAEAPSHVAGQQVLYLQHIERLLSHPIQLLERR